MRIDRIYVACCKTDYYLTKICIASIRYWNKTIPVCLIKDHSQGQFDTTELERIMQVKVLDTNIKNLSYYSILYPFIHNKNERVFFLDADIVWLGDMIPILEKYTEDLVVQKLMPPDYLEEMNRWYFNHDLLVKNYPDYRYPGFLFNTGQFVCNTGIFNKADFDGLVNWEEPVTLNDPATFVCVDQSVINFVLAKKIKNGQQISIADHFYYYWGGSEEAKSFSVDDIQQKKSRDILIHWYGKKTGIVSFMPCASILKFYEEQYYSKSKHPFFNLHASRFKRTLQHLPVYIYEQLKWIYYKIK